MLAANKRKYESDDSDGDSDSTDNDDFTYLSIDYTAIDGKNNCDGGGSGNSGGAGVSINDKSTKLEQNASDNYLLENARMRHSWLHHKICTSTPLLASKILTSNLDVVGVECVYMEPILNDFQTFSIKHCKK